METPEITQPTHADFRSATHASTRNAKQAQKYYNFRSGPMSRIGQPILVLPEDPRPLPFGTVAAPLLVHPDALRMRTWTKRDQFDWRTWDIWPLDRKDHKVGRRKRGRGCDYVPPRWKMERRMKSGKDLIAWEDDLVVEEEDWTEDVEYALWEALLLDEGVLDEDSTPSESSHHSSDAEYDMLSDLGSEVADHDWELVDAH